ncbi:uncharacterized protein N7458_002763 [Penicillium daleae]|uniref:Rhamnogalacturonase A/B/Epimerase-like pectate lyase domain-containing protein n=1 Tax=Penicillium daleae TaxID=63821 RepID=A0AAD6G6J0_9EURO|nr:uncharacterized protein N7458_002763 [Penicillium daleae]KAJ5461211.1 hypothetical protein N7458_002763 [Penicillium daleae]
MRLVSILAAAAAAAAAVAAADHLVLPPLPSGYSSPALPIGPPQAPPAYMVNNQGNTHGVAPDAGTMNGPILTDKQMENVVKVENSTQHPSKRATSTFWMDGITHGEMPLAGDGYQFYRNVQDFGAMGDGVTDDTEAINRAVSYSSSSNSTERCGQSCGSTSVYGALVFFPPGTYLISTPIIQYYYTQFVGDATDRPTIKGSANFTGIALIDTDPYIPGGNGAEWYINQNQFFRQIRNFIFDMTSMAFTNYDGDQEYNATGLHWQVAQATSLQNLDFQMSVSTATNTTTMVGIFMENGSGGFLSDLTFFGGNIGFRAGNQQYTARNLQFTSCLTAISMIWDWGFTWQNIYVYSCWVAIDCTSIGGIDSQGTGSISVLDSHFNGVPYPITLRNGGPYPNIILDNLLVENSADVVLVSGGEIIVAGSTDALYFTSWNMGRLYDSLSGDGQDHTGFLSPTPNKPASLLDSSGQYFSQSRPQYETYFSSDFVVATSNGISNDGTGDQTGAINTLLSSSVGKPVFFPAGIYQVESTVKVPVGSIIVGEGWSQIMGTGSYFEDASNPQVMVQVGKVGDSGVIQISDMLFTVKGATAGCILMEWNVHESTQGSAAMWDSHFRVGGAAGSNLQMGNCPKGSDINIDCIAASMLLHLTEKSSGYFENLWVWTADHDLDEPVGSANTTTASQLNIFTGRGVLVESQGPTWFYGTSVEHSVLYQLTLSGAEDIFITHVQTETPYFQPNPDASQPFDISRSCVSGSNCEDAWAFRVLDSSDILVYTAGFYSFFNAFEQTCLNDESCQERLVETSFTQGFWLYNIFTIGAAEVVSPMGGIPPTLQSDDNQNGYSTEISAWLVLAEDGGDLGVSSGIDGDTVIVYIGDLVWVEPSPILQCSPPCIMVLPPSPVPAPTPVNFSPIPTSINLGGTVISVVTPSPVTPSEIGFFPVTIPSGVYSSAFSIDSSLTPGPVVISGGGTTQSITFDPTTGAGGVSANASLVYYSLPTTIYTSNGVTQTFSEAQFTEWATLPTTTTITTSLSTRASTSSGSSSSTTTTTLLPVWINIGGFYWSPIPLPGPTPFPIPRLPELPEIPDLPCFKLFDIFSIDCPPDKGKPTTTYTSGPASPSCTKSCGTYRTSDSTSSSTSSCTTTTSIECTSTTICNTYIGCECQTKTVTDYWVSCATESCTTTSSSIVSGCDVTATTTTTGIACLTVSLNPDTDDEGDDAYFPAVASAVIVTNPEFVSVGSSSYAVSGGEIIVGGGAYSVLSVTEAVTTEIDGTSAVIYPSSTGTSYDVAVPGLLATGSSASSASTTAPITTTTSTSEPSATRIAAFMVFQEDVNGEGIFQWWVVDEYTNSVTDVCDASADIEVDSDSAPGVDFIYPDTTIGPFTSHGIEGCVYVGTTDGATVGMMTCPGVDSIVCEKDPQYNTDFECSGTVLTSCVRCIF